MKNSETELEWTQAALRKELSTLAAPRRIDLGAPLFGAQRAFYADRSRFQTALCSGRAGKTYGCAAKLLDGALTKSGSVALYVTRRRKNSKLIVWEPLKEMNRELKLGGEALEGELGMNFPNGSKVQLAGVNDETRVDDFRGVPYSVAVLDEAQSFPAFIEKLVNEAIGPRLMDFNGALCLVGTPGPVPTGYFHAQCHSSAWSHHTWTAFDNPHILRKSGKTAQQFLEEELARRGVSVEDPAIQREYFGRWVLDENALVFRYSAALNDYAELPALTSYVIGVDLGYEDADALAVLGWSAASPNLYLVEEVVTPKQTLTPLAEAIAKLVKRYKPQAVVMDQGGLGKKIALTLQERLSLPIEAADKERKFEFVEMLNDSMRTAHFFAKRDSRFAQDAMLLEWDRDKSTPDKLAVKDSFHSDILDAVLYAYRRACHWLYVPPKKDLPLPGTEAWLAHQAQAMRQQEADRLAGLMRRQKQAKLERAEQEDDGT